MSLLLILVRRASLHRQDFPAFEFSIPEHSAVRSISHRIVSNSNFIAHLQSCASPVSSFEIIRTHTLKSKHIDAALGIWDIHPDPYMGVGPVHLLYGPCDALFYLRVERGEGMMCGCRCGREDQNYQHQSRKYRFSKVVAH